MQPQSLFASQQFATAIYQSELTYRLRQLGYEISSGRSGAPEIKGYTQEYLDASSPRSQQIRAYLERSGRIGKEAAEIAAHSTRDKKEIHSLREVTAAHRALAAEYGHQAEAVVRAAQERFQHQKQESGPRLRASEAMTFSRDKNFEREAVIDERALVRDALRRGMGEITYGQVRGNLDARLATGEFQTVERGHIPGRQFTTAKTIEAEQEIVRRMREGQGKAIPAMDRREAIKVSDQHPNLNRAQKGVVEDVLSSADRIQGIQGYAGVGKTTTLATLRSAVESRLPQVLRVIEWIRKNYAKPLHIAALARLASMSPASLHRQFKAVTAMSPLQYQKQVRLQKAQQIMLSESKDAASSGYAVGYGSPSQFSREYQRMFGAPPHQHMHRMRLLERA